MSDENSLLSKEAQKRLSYLRYRERSYSFQADLALHGGDAINEKCFRAYAAQDKETADGIESFIARYPQDELAPEGEC